MGLGDKKYTPTVNIFLGEPDSPVRHALRQVLLELGFKRVKDYPELPPIHQALQFEVPDLVIIDANLESVGKSVPQLIQELRFGKLGNNPFTPIIVTMWNPTAESVRAVVNAGIDDLLVKPLAPGDLISRIKVLALNRKPFVVTSDYIGPDRRKDPSRESDVPLVDVPNTFKAKLDGNPIPQKDLQKLINDAQGQINEMKMQRNAFQIAFLVELMLPKLEKGLFDGDLRANLQKLHMVGKDTAERLQGTKFAHVADICTTLIKVSSSLHSSLPNPSSKDIRLLKPLADAAIRAFHPDENEEEMAKQISSAVNNFQKRMGRG